MMNAGESWSSTNKAADYQLYLVTVLITMITNDKLLQLHF